MDDDETLTAYHEAGHVVVGYLLGARIDEVRLGSMIDDDLPRRFGDCIVNWGAVHPACDWQTQCEIMTILAGPVAEMVYRGERLHPASFAPWQSDWHQAVQRSARYFSTPLKQVRFLESVMVVLHQKISADSFWAAIAALSDELLAHEALDHDDVVATVSFWLGTPQD
ncbi:cell division protein FtsH [Novipirellula artificiosorum]|uniref:cell division protein FtsH n=1 Tax=Novipirellula artificiosorum TaxID=2528016 RepID=UPI001E4F4B52|nr:cell division protein FtsH [Novipirellula artificiosorum]